MKAKQPIVPAERTDTLRQLIVAMLQRESLSAMEISEEAGIPIQDVYGHLEHIRQSLHREGAALTVRPAECRNCGFCFAKRERLKRPGRCPVCRGESISQPRFRIFAGTG